MPAPFHAGGGTVAPMARESASPPRSTACSTAPLEELPRARASSFVAQARSSGDAPGARAIAAIAAKPTRTAWALNQVARSRPEALAGPAGGPKRRGEPFGRRRRRPAAGAARSPRSPQRRRARGERGAGGDGRRAERAAVAPPGRDPPGHDRGRRRRSRAAARGKAHARRGGRRSVRRRRRWRGQRAACAVSSSAGPRAGRARVRAHRAAQGGPRGAGAQEGGGGRTARAASGRSARPATARAGRPRREWARIDELQTAAHAARVEAHVAHDVATHAARKAREADDAVKAIEARLAEAREALLELPRLTPGRRRYRSIGRPSASQPKRPPSRNATGTPCSARRDARSLVLSPERQ